MNLPISAITINRDQRQRREVGDCSDLIDSIRRLGIITPIALDREHNLIAGERRLTAMTALGWTELTHGRHFIYLDELSAEARMAVELEENVKRSDLPWQDQCRAVQAYHALRKQSTPEWRHEDTANALGFSKQHISKLLGVAEAAAADPKLFERERLSVAINQVERNRQRKAATVIDEIIASNLGAEGPAPAAPAPAPDVPLINADFREWASTYSGPPFNFLHCDFPYGIDFDKQHGQNSANVERYADSKEYYVDLIRSMAKLPLSTECHLLFWFSMNHYALTVTLLREAGWTVQPHPVYWAKSDNSGILPDPKRGPRRNVETALVCTRGDRFIVEAVSNFWHGPRGTATHASVKPVPMLEHFFRMFVDETSHVLDPTCGSGNAIRAALNRGAKRALGIELDPTFHADAVREWRDTIEVSL